MCRIQKQGERSPRRKAEKAKKNTIERIKRKGVVVMRNCLSLFFLEEEPMGEKKKIVAQSRLAYYIILKTRTREGTLTVYIILIKVLNAF